MMGNHGSPAMCAAGAYNRINISHSGQLQTNVEATGLGPKHHLDLEDGIQKYMLDLPSKPCKHTILGFPKRCNIEEMPPCSHAILASTGCDRYNVVPIVRNPGLHVSNAHGGCIARSRPRSFVGVLRKFISRTYAVFGAQRAQQQS